MTVIVKQSGKRPTEPYQRAKLERSVYTILATLKTPDGQAKDTAKMVCDRVEQWLDARHEVTSSDIRRQVVAALEPLHPDAAYLYKQYKTIL